MENVTIITARTEHSSSSSPSTKFNIDKDISAVAIYESHVAEIACRNDQLLNQNKLRDHDRDDGASSSSSSSGSSGSSKRVLQSRSLEATSRKGLLFFSGSVHKSQRLRNSILSYYKENPEDGVLITTQPFNGDEYTQKMLEHKYCLQVPGYANLSPRVSEYTLLGCIPVVIIAKDSSFTLNPLHRTIDWTQIAIEVCAALKLHPIFNYPTRT